MKTTVELANECSGGRTGISGRWVLSDEDLEAFRAMLAAAPAPPFCVSKFAESETQAVLSRTSETQSDDAKDAARYRWLRENMLGVDFDWNESGVTALSFEMPDGCAYGGNCDENIDAAIDALKGGE